MGLHFHYQDDDVRASMPRNEKYEVARHYMHTHETAELYYFIAGKTVFHIEGTEYVPERGDILFIRPAEAHYTAVDNNYPYERAVINFDISSIPNLVFSTTNVRRKLFDYVPVVVAREFVTMSPKIEKQTSSTRRIHSLFVFNELFCKFH